MQRVLMVDVDGVLITGRPEDGKSWATDLEADLGVPLGPLQDRFFAPHWDEIVTGVKPLRPTLDEALAEINSGLSVTTFLDYWFTRDARRDEGLISALQRARADGLRVLLATNQEPTRARYLWDTLACPRSPRRCSAPLIWAWRNRHRGSLPPPWPTPVPRQRHIF
ncbi:HAD family hydrolase [Aliiroseovarius sp.]|uniref:HAD family hydrolase n=1 Tax=Aliiroseovarius sp. TaxID=1872442 RepID=UPI003BAB33D6